MINILPQPVLLFSMYQREGLHFVQEKDLTEAATVTAFR